MAGRVDTMAGTSHIMAGLVLGGGGGTLHLLCSVYLGYISRCILANF